MQPTLVYQSPSKQRLHGDLQGQRASYTEPGTGTLQVVSSAQGSKLNLIAAILTVILA